MEKQLATKDEQLAVKDEQMKEREATFKDQLAAKDEQLAAKDRQIDELIKAAKQPRTVNNNTNNHTNQTNNQTNNYSTANINVYGQESMDHISNGQLQELIKDPDTSIARLVTMKHRLAENRNVRVPNKRARMVECLVDLPDGERKWEGRDKDGVVSDLVESSAMVLEGAADKTTGMGQRYERWVGRLMQSHDEYHLGDSAGKAGGKQFKQQMEMVHQSLADITRT
jgi:hypothetical protein